MNDAKWYVAHTYSGYERNVSGAVLKAADTRKMRELIQETTIPTEQVTEIGQDGKKRTIERLIYPGYVFIKMVATDPQAWHLVRNVRGVTGFIGEQNKPVPLTDSEIESLGVERKGGVQLTYDIGDEVKVIDGPLEDFTAKVVSISAEDGRVKVLVPMAGRDIEAELDLDQIIKL
ncbi:MAG: transcription termination/antitermination protein NusG [Oscillospiraceae bacterium]|jgi:transcriptional antiterminator NusG|nr:transcription termination/antitermination protein NusG [Oscillospiraceae bacterium]